MRLDTLIADIQMLALSLSTQPDAEQRRLTLIRLRETSYEATFEVTQQIPLRPRARPQPSHHFGVNDL